MPPPSTFPSGRISRYFWPSVTSVNLAVIPKRPATIIQKVAPGPPTATAIATPAMLPRPTVAESAADSAWKWLTSPTSAGLLYFPRVTFSACPNARMLMNPIRKVKNTAPITSQSTTSGSTWSGSQNITSQKKTEPMALTITPKAASTRSIRSCPTARWASWAAAGTAARTRRRAVVKARLTAWRRPRRVMRPSLGVVVGCRGTGTRYRPSGRGATGRLYWAVAHPRGGPIPTIQRSTACRRSCRSASSPTSRSTA